MDCQTICVKCERRMVPITIGERVKIGERMFKGGDLLRCPECGLEVIHVDKETAPYRTEEVCAGHLVECREIAETLPCRYCGGSRRVYDEEVGVIRCPMCRGEK